MSEQTTRAKVTEIGKTKILAAMDPNNPSTVTVTEIAIGNGETVHSGGESELYNETLRKPLSRGGFVDGANNTVYFDMDLTANEGPYTIREAGVFDDEGDLIAVAHYNPAIEKTLPSSGQAQSGTIRLNVVVDDASVVLFDVDETAFVRSDRRIDTGEATGIKGGGDLSANRTHELDWSGLSDGSGFVLADKLNARKTTGTRDQRSITLQKVRDVITATDEEVRNSLGDNHVASRHLINLARLSDPAGEIVWVRPDGDDANDGSENTAARAKQTLQGAVDHASRFIPGRNPVNIRLGQPGTYHVDNIPFGSRLRIVGNRSDVENYKINNPTAGRSVLSLSGSYVDLDGVTIWSEQTGVNLLWPFAGSELKLSYVRIDGPAQPSTLLRSDANSTIQTGEFLDIVRPATFAFNATRGQIILTNGSYVNFRNNPEFHTVYSASQNGGITVGSATLNGAAAGIRYRATTNAVINTFGGGSNRLNGNQAGSVSTGGLYV